MPLFFADLLRGPGYGSLKRSWLQQLVTAHPPAAGLLEMGQGSLVLRKK